MRLSLNDVVPVEKWTLEIQIGEQVYPVRPWTLRDSEMLATIGTRTGEEGYEWIESLFDPIKPDVRNWSEEDAGNYLAMILGYRDAMLQKKRQHIKARVREMASRS